MPIDASIPLQVKPAEFTDIGTIRARGLQLRALGRADQQAERDLADQRALRDIYQQSVGPDGQLDETKLMQGVANAGMGDRIPGLQKELTANRKGRIDADSAELKAHKDKIDMVNAGLSSLLANPNVTQGDVIAQINSMVDQGIITADQGAQSARSLPGRPEALRPYLVQKALEGADASKRLEALLPKYNEQNRGGTINEGTIDTLTGKRTAGVDIQRTVTPEAQLASDTARQLGSVTYQQDNAGNFVALPTKPGAGPIRPTAVVDAQGNPVGGKGSNLNDSQSKALLFGSRARDADSVINGLAAKGVQMGSVPAAVAEKVPLVGGALAAGINATMVSPEQQQVEQAQRDFMNAVLRRESGALIGPDEFTSGKKQYFPQIGDSPEVIAQKARNRALAIQGILVEVPETQRNSLGPGGTPAAPAAPAAPAGTRPPLDAFFKRPK